MSRILLNSTNQVTNSYENHTGWSKGVDLVKQPNQLADVIAHTKGKVIKVIDYMKGKGKQDQEGMGYGNYVMVLHEELFESRYVVTLYAHLDSVSVVEDAEVQKGQTIGKMGNTGNSYGAHLHFEIRLYKDKPSGYLHDVASFDCVDPTSYLDKDLPSDIKELDEGSYPNYAEGSDKYYRVRLSFKDIKSSKGSYSKWENAYKRWKAYASQGYHVYDNEGNQLDTSQPKNIETKPILTAESYPSYPYFGLSYYRIRKSFGDSKTSKGSYKSFSNAFKTWQSVRMEGYHIYDSQGKQLD